MESVSSWGLIVATRQDEATLSRRAWIPILADETLSRRLVVVFVIEIHVTKNVRAAYNIVPGIVVNAFFVFDKFRILQSVYKRA
jgi:hypothetical protein